MLTLRWDKPVRAGGHLIFGPLEAHNFMISDWPHLKDRDFAIAENAILAALDGRQSPDEAREKFEAALKSAQLN
ncbi:MULTISPECIES: DUF982 domain-containing protein [Rhizobium/Agrobacterium group]|uniref:DUF982 domain-containing protein n=2 Tax=Neorhizobium TaxID=1525371 RepID=A0ABV0MD50_9HYPH|nr:MULTISPECIES: DUF982 domain-containing protein [Rhizobium/Agrobacterium group]KGE02172.1 hypothetical protein JL39_01135 [Rhizobium sp. YS-1r]MCC2614080.1 DUF982 domain-containing protein [Neorhizobium petrolearium]WGI71596.1 DUF982 domain-containing protein [Neorhizobium petrolearium]